MKKDGGRMRRKLRLLGFPGATAATFVLCIGILAQGASAQNPFGSGGLALTKQDLALQGETRRTLLDDQPVGTSLRWSNSDSENSGTLTLLGIFQRNGRDCWRVRYDLDVDREARLYDVSLCRADDGTVKFLE